MFRMFSAVGILALLVSEAQACALADFSIKQPNWRRTIADFVEASGELVSNCDDAVGAQIQVVFRDKAGQVVKAEDLWPASTKNIAAHDSYPFTLTFHVGTEAATMSMGVIELRRW